MTRSYLISELKALKVFVYRNRFQFDYNDSLNVVSWLNDLIKEISKND